MLKNNLKYEKLMFCSHGVPIDAEHYCNRCSRTGLPAGKNYTEYLAMLDWEIENYDYLLNDAIWRKERFIEKYKPTIQQSSDLKETQ